MPPPRRCLGYARVSGQEQGRTGTSLDGQRGEIERYCRELGYPTPEIRVEVESAGAEKLDRRAILRALLADVREGDLVIVAKQDRWSRDTLFYLQSTRDIVSKGARFFSIAERFDPDTSEGRFAATIMAAVAEQERERIRARTVGRRKALRDEGRYVEGLPPIGYERGEKNILRIVASDAAIVRDAYARCIAGSSVEDIAARLRRTRAERHGWDKKTIGKMLRARVYLGEVATSVGAWVASHEPIVDRITWERAQRALDSRRVAGPRPLEESRTHHWLLRGLATCARCGAHMSACYGPSDKVRGYYMCRAKCGARLVVVAVVDAVVSALVLAHLEDMREDLATGADSTPERVDFTEREEKLRRKRERTIDLATDGTIDRVELQRRLALVDRGLSRLVAEMDANAREVAAVLPAARAATLREVRTIAKGWARLDVPEQREILDRFTVSIAIARDEAPRIEWKSLADLAT